MVDITTGVGRHKFITVTFLYIRISLDVDSFLECELFSLCVSIVDYIGYH